MSKLNLDIDNNSEEGIKDSFDRIAVDLINNWDLKINGAVFSFTEIEFYYFLKGVHEDTATHEHKFDSGVWRWHQQGLDIALQGNDQSDGGILLRGIKSENKYINGPKRILHLIFERFGDVTEVNKEFGLIPKKVPTNLSIYKTRRHGLSAKQENKFIEAPYRYYTDIDAWDIKHKSVSEKARMKELSTLHDYR
jgi:hypothetical protein